jgi:hypothetical protein
MPKFVLSALFGSALLIAFAAPTMGATTLVTQNVSLGGTTFLSKWENSRLINANNPGYPSFPGSAAWPGPISGVGSAGANLVKVSGNAYPGAESLYTGGNSTGNVFGSQLSLIDSISGIDLQQVSFQIILGTAGAHGFFNGIFPVLNYNGGSQSLTATPVILGQEAGEPFENPDTGEFEDVFITNYQLVWDLSAITDPITSIDVRWSVVQHAQIYALQLDQGGIALVPEPSSVALLMMGAGAFALLRRRKAAAR